MSGGTLRVRIKMFEQYYEWSNTEGWNKNEEIRRTGVLRNLAG